LFTNRVGKVARIMLAAKPMENEVGAQVLHCHGARGWMDVKKTRKLAKGASFSLCEVLGKKNSAVCTICISLEVSVARNLR